MTESPYGALPAPPATLDGPGVLARLVDGMGFRYRWATEGLRPEALGFRPCEGAFTLGEVLAHMNLLVHWVEDSVREPAAGEPEGIDAGFVVAPGEWPDLRADTLACLVGLRDLLAGSEASRLAAVTLTGDPRKGPQPFWSAINGPLADFLTHVGQVSSWRRMAGDPAPRADVFRGVAPRDRG